MHKLFKKQTLRLPMLTIALTFTFTFTSCWDENWAEDCDSYATFIYEYNLPDVDMFHKEVSNVDVLFFDDNGIYQNRVTGSATAGMLPQGYKLTLPYNSMKNVGRILTLGGDYGKAYELQPANLVAGQTSINDMRLQVKYNASTSGSMPAVFLGGRLENNKIKQLPAVPGMDIKLLYREEVHKVELMKISKTFRIALKVTENGALVPGSNFNFEITAPNSLLDMNAETVGTAPCVYVPYVIENHAASTDYTAVQIWTPRLKYGAAQKITIKENTFPFVVAFEEDLNDLIKVMALQEYNSLVANTQEYMDRKDVYSLVIILEKDSTGPRSSYKSVAVKINEWLVRDDIVDP